MLTSLDMITTGSESQSAVSPVPLEALKRFLELNQWHLKPNHIGNLLVYEGMADDLGRPIILTLPITAEFEDAPKLVSKVLNVLAVIRSTSIQAICEEINNSE